MQYEFVCIKRDWLADEGLDGPSIKAVKSFGKNTKKIQLLRRISILRFFGERGGGANQIFDENRGHFPIPNKFDNYKKVINSEMAENAYCLKNR